MAQCDQDDPTRWTSDNTAAPGVTVQELSVDIVHLQLEGTCAMLQSVIDMHCWEAAGMCSGQLSHNRASC